VRKTTTKSVFGGVVAALLLFAGAGAAFGQGEINFFTYNVNTNYGIVFQSDGMTRASGSAFSAQLFGSTTENGTFAAISPVTSFATGISAGYVDYATVTLPVALGNAPGDTYYYELMVWTASAGSYANAVTINGDQYGTSQVESLILGEAGSDVYPEPTSNGFPSFTLTLVPEPATCALMGLGGLSLLLFRRRK
jgi:PEP-CTERM motif